MESSCEEEKQVAYFCANSTVTNGSFITKESSQLICPPKKPWIQTRKCPACEDNESAYNEGYYDSDYRD